MSTLYSNLIAIQQHFHNSRVGRKRFFLFLEFIFLSMQSKGSLLRNFYDLKLCLLLEHKALGFIKIDIFI
jgi:hypothetical protein